jgi:hypothetical protein
MTMTRSIKALIAFTTAALAISTAGFAHDAASMRDLDIEKGIEAGSLVTMRVGTDVVPHQFSVVEARGSMRHVAMTVADQRLYRHSPALGVFVPKLFRGNPEMDRRIDQHPVIRMEAIVDCLTRSVTWKGIGYADAMVGPNAIYTPFRSQPRSDTLPRSLDRKSTDSLCDLPVATTVLP